MADLIGFENVGYKIFKQGKNAVIANREKDNQFVAWSYVMDKDCPDFFWGRYGSLEYATECYIDKERANYG